MCQHSQYNAAIRRDDIQNQLEAILFLPTLQYTINTMDGGTNSLHRYTSTPAAILPLSYAAHWHQWGMYGETAAAEPNRDSNSASVSRLTSLALGRSRGSPFKQRCNHAR